MMLRAPLPIALVALVLVLGRPAAVPAQDRENLFEQGLEGYRAGEYAKAQRLLREYVETYGERRGAEAAHLGEAYHYLGLMTPDASLAEGYFLAVTQRYPSAPVADESAVRLAQLYAMQGNYAEARKQWQALARGYPLSRWAPEATLRVGQSYFAEQEWEPAYEAFSAGFSRMKEFSRSGGRGANLRDLEGEYVYWLGRTLLARRSHGDARKYLNLVLLDYPDHPLEPLALYYLAESYREDGKEREAADNWRRFGESVRNTSLETLAENPNLLAVARAREAGTLDRPAEAAAPPSREVADGAGGEGAAEAGVEDRDAERERARGRPADGGGLRAPARGRAGGAASTEPPEEPPDRRGAAAAGEDPAREDRAAMAAVD
nr:tetratricopeptide repeat protein [Gemmatimonadota bacterium]